MRQIEFYLDLFVEKGLLVKSINLDSGNFHYQMKSTGQIYKITTEEEKALLNPTLVNENNERLKGCL